MCLIGSLGSSQLRSSIQGHLGSSSGRDHVLSTLYRPESHIEKTCCAHMISFQHICIKSPNQYIDTLCGISYWKV